MVFNQIVHQVLVVTFLNRTSGHKAIGQVNSNNVHTVSEACESPIPIGFKHVFKLLKSITMSTCLCSDACSCLTMSLSITCTVDVSVHTLLLGWVDATSTALD